MTSFTQDGSSHMEMYSLHFSIVEGRGTRRPSFLQSMGARVNMKEGRPLMASGRKIMNRILDTFSKTVTKLPFFISLCKQQNSVITELNTNKPKHVSFLVLLKKLQRQDNS